MRGVALLGILAMNIVNLAWPGPAYSDPLVGAGANALDRGIWVFNHIVFDTEIRPRLCSDAGLTVRPADLADPSAGWP